MLTIKINIKETIKTKTNAFLALYSAINIIQIAVGLLNQEKCEIQPMIPVWLVIMGSGSLILSLTKLISGFKITIESDLIMKHKKQESIILNFTIHNVYFYLTAFLLFVWFMIGNFWIYSLLNTVTFNNKLNNDSKKNYCDKTTYWLAFWTITFMNTFIAYFI